MRTCVVDLQVASQTSVKSIAANTMKFGQNLSRNQVPEWAASYIDYKTLKRLIKAALKAIEAREEPDLAGRMNLDLRQDEPDTLQVSSLPWTANLKM